jgi:oligopeptide transport system substrate-binding protein
LEKNPNYWDAGNVRLQRVTYYVLPDRSDQAARYLANELDWTDSFAANQRAWLKSRLGDQVVNSPYFAAYFLGMNFQLPPIQGQSGAAPGAGAGGGPRTDGELPEAGHV